MYRKLLVCIVCSRGWMLSNRSMMSGTVLMRLRKRKLLVWKSSSACVMIERSTLILLRSEEQKGRSTGLYYKSTARNRENAHTPCMLHCIVVLKMWPTVDIYTPKSIQPLLAEVLGNEFDHAYSNGLWGFLWFLCFLCLPSPGGERNISLSVPYCLLVCIIGRILTLWQEARNDVRPCSSCKSLQSSNLRRALDDQDVLAELHSRHPDHNLPSWLDSMPPSLVVESTAILSSLKSLS